jgi:Flp pilus assembly protein TadD
MTMAADLPNIKSIQWPLDQRQTGQPQPGPDYPILVLNRVRGLLGRGQYNAASLLIPTLEKIGVAPDEIATLKVEIAQGRGDGSTAAAILDEALLRMPNCAALLVLRARMSLSNGDRVGAALAAAEAITAAPSNARAKSLLGQALLELGQTEQATICLIEAIDAMPDDGPTLAALVRVAPEAAETAIRKTIANGRTDTVTRNNLINVLLAVSNFEGARQEIADLTCKGAADANTGILAVRLAVDQEDWGEADSLFQQSTLHLPRHA